MKRKGNILLFVLGLFCLFIIMALSLSTITQQFVSTNSNEYLKRQTYLNVKGVVDVIVAQLEADPDILDYLESSDDVSSDMCKNDTQYNTTANLKGSDQNYNVDLNFRCEMVEKEDDGTFIRVMRMRATNKIDDITSTITAVFKKKNVTKIKDKELVDYLDKYETIVKKAGFDIKTTDEKESALIVDFDRQELDSNKFENYASDIIDVYLHSYIKNTTINGNIIIDNDNFSEGTLGLRNTTINGTLLNHKNIKVFSYGNSNDQAISNTVNRLDEKNATIKACLQDEMYGVNTCIDNYQGTLLIKDIDETLSIDYLDPYLDEKDIDFTLLDEYALKIENKKTFCKYKGDRNTFCDLLYRTYEENEDIIVENYSGQESLFSEFNEFDEDVIYQKIPRILYFDNDIYNKIEYSLSHFNGLIYAPNSLLHINTNGGDIEISGKVICKGIIISGEGNLILNSVNYTLQLDPKFIFEKYE